jgi:ATP-binding cassette subfamily C protein
MLPLVALCARALPQLQGLQENMQNYAHARPALDEVVALIAGVEAHAEPDEPGRTAPSLNAAIRLENVDFAFAGRRAALRGVDLDLPALSVTALVGPSGAGKSTLADILGGLLAPETGRMLVDGEPLDGAARRAWRAKVAYVQQEAVLFAGSVRDNLLWAQPDASDGQLRQALERAAARFAYDLPGGIDCDLGEGGRQLSGGERQRIALARALLREPDLLILDEATSALDAAAEREIAEVIGRLKGTLTIVIIGHRGLLTGLADRQVVLEGGRVVASG